MKSQNEKFLVKRLGKQDVPVFQKLIQIFKEVFEMEETMEASEIYLMKLLEKRDFIAYGVFLDEEIVGGLTAYELMMYHGNYFEVFIFDIAVKPAFQRKGLGRMLLLSLEKYCKQNDIKVMFVEANEEDVHAVDFYHSTGGKAEKVVHFNYLLNK